MSPARRVTLLVRLLLLALLVVVLGFLFYTVVTRDDLPVAAPPAEQNAWWTDAVFYELFVRSFYDSDGDGHGDLNGVLARLDYLNDGDPAHGDDLGVTALYLMPVTEANSYHGYDPTDYYAVERDYGDVARMRALVDAAHARGMRVIVDLVINHTGRSHPWFQEAAADPAGPRSDWYIWIDTPPPNFGPWGQVVWHPAPGTADAGRSYFGLFGPSQPDLNYRNPAVTAAMEAIAGFWLDDMGVDGFRLDAARHLIEDGELMSDTPETLAWLQQFRAFVKARSPQALLVAETWTVSNLAAPYVNEGAADLAFEYDLAETIVVTVNAGLPEVLESKYRIVAGLYPPGQYATFLSNHDQDRVFSQLQADPLRARQAATLLLTLPGVPFIYYGEEIGLVGSGSDLARRRPLPWSDDPGAGFSAGEPWQAPAADAGGTNITAQQDDPGSLLAVYRRLIALRGAQPALRGGGIVILEGKTCAKTSAYVRYGAGGAPVLVVYNFSAEALVSCRFRLRGSGIPAGDYRAAADQGDAADVAFRVDAAGAIDGLTLDWLSARAAAIFVFDN